MGTTQIKKLSYESYRLTTFRILHFFPYFSGIMKRKRKAVYALTLIAFCILVHKAGSKSVKLQNSPIRDCAGEWVCCEKNDEEEKRLTADFNDEDAESMKRVEKSVAYPEACNAYCCQQKNDEEEKAQLRQAEESGDIKTVEQA